MKRYLSIILAALLAFPAPSFALTSIAVTRRKSADTIIPHIPAVTFATGAVTTDGFDTPTMACGCAAEGSAIALGTPACHVATLPAEDAATGFYNLTIKAANIANDRCVVYMTGAAGIDPVVVYINTKQLLSNFDVTNPTGTAVTVASTGSGGIGLDVQGGPSSTTAGGIAMKLTGGTSTWANAGGNGGDALYAVGGAKHASGSLDGKGMNIVGTGTAAAILATGRRGIHAVTNAADGYGFFGQASSAGGGGAGFVGHTGGDGLDITAGSTGKGVSVAGGPTSGDGISVSTTSGDALKLNAAGSGKFGANIISAATDAVKLVPASGSYAINCGSAVCFNGAGLGGGLVRE